MSLMTTPSIFYEKGDILSFYEFCGITVPAYGWFHHRGSKLDLRSDLRSTQKTVAPFEFEFRAGLEIEMKFISNRRNWRFVISIRDQQPSSTNVDHSISDRGRCWCNRALGTQSPVSHHGRIDSRWIRFTSLHVGNTADVALAATSPPAKKGWQQQVQGGTLYHIKVTALRDSGRDEKYYCAVPPRNPFFFFWPPLPVFNQNPFACPRQPPDLFFVGPSPDPSTRCVKSIDRLIRGRSHAYAAELCTVSRVHALWNQENGDSQPTGCWMGTRGRPADLLDAVTRKHPALSFLVISGHLGFPPLNSFISLMNFPFSFLLYHSTSACHALAFRLGPGWGSGKVPAPCQSESGSIPVGVTPGFSHVGISPDDATGRQVFLGISRSPRPRIPALLHTPLVSPAPALRTSRLRAAQISPFHSKNFAIKPFERGDLHKQLLGGGRNERDWSLGGRGRWLTQGANQHLPSSLRSPVSPCGRGRGQIRIGGRGDSPRLATCRGSSLRMCVPCGLHTPRDAQHTSQVKPWTLNGEPETSRIHSAAKLDSTGGWVGGSTSFSLHYSQSRCTPLHTLRQAQGGCVTSLGRHSLPGRILPLITKRPGTIEDSSEDMLNCIRVNYRQRTSAYFPVSMQPASQYDPSNNTSPLYNNCPLCGESPDLCKYSASSVIGRCQPAPISAAEIENRYSTARAR
ncbi:hypothetical protein PR048_030041 [Dryococelus australis]|uniref:Uncharacterized protein n=1 Tax=Dryococelus australis TaxID=614101 RepID=A0ABQ9GAQ4_9NEOP|nr:hypothetical protein PR048_030041 [Dryococelus australis]